MQQSYTAPISPQYLRDGPRVAELDISPQTTPLPVVEEEKLSVDLKNLTEVSGYLYAAYAKKVCQTYMLN